MNWPAVWVAPAETASSATIVPIPSAVPSAVRNARPGRWRMLVSA